MKLFIDHEEIIEFIEAYKYLQIIHMFMVIYHDFIWFLWVSNGQPPSSPARQLQCPLPPSPPSVKGRLLPGSLVELGRTWSTCSWGFGAIFLGEQEYRDLMMGYKHALGGVDTLEIVLGRIPHSYIYICISGHIWTNPTLTFAPLSLAQPSAICFGPVSAFVDGLYSFG